MSDSPATTRYLAAFGELARITAAYPAVPETLWAELREAWEAMSRDEQDALNALLRAEAVGQALRGGK